MIISTVDHDLSEDRSVGGVVANNNSAVSSTGLSGRFSKLLCKRRDAS